MKSRKQDTNELLVQAFAKLDALALGLSLGVLLGLLIVLATLILVIKGGETVGPNLALLNQYFAGYSVSLAGSLIGFAYGFGTGFVLGWLAAFLHNLIIRIYLALIQLRASVSSITDYIDPDHSKPFD